MNPIQKRQFIKQVLDVIGSILEDQGSVNQSSHSSSNSLSMISESAVSRTNTSITSSK